jgi:hypothetical protein
MSKSEYKVICESSVWVCSNSRSQCQESLNMIHSLVHSLALNISLTWVYIKNSGSRL